MAARYEREDCSYFIRRTREERERASTCEDNAVAITHLKMADEYEKRMKALSTELQAAPS